MAKTNKTISILHNKLHTRKNVIMTIQDNCRQRYDLSDYLIHFIHQQTSTSDDNTINTIESLSVLKKILETGHLLPGWAKRDGERTIYGYNKAICFTEMPFLALLYYIESRKDPYKVDYYGIAFKKDLLYKLGARPVIYGLSGYNTECIPFETKQDGCRVIQEELLPINEQYRFVTTKKFSCQHPDYDWMHEREWRLSTDNIGDDGILLYDVPNIVIIVKTNEEKSLIYKLLNSKAQDLKSYQKEHIRSWNVISYNNDIRP